MSAVCNSGSCGEMGGETPTSGGAAIKTGREGGEACWALSLGSRRRGKVGTARRGHPAGPPLLCLVTRDAQSRDGRSECARGLRGAPPGVGGHGLGPVGLEDSCSGLWELGGREPHDELIGK